MRGPTAAAQREARERAQRLGVTATELGEARAGRARQQPPAAPAGAAEVESESPGPYHYGYPYRDAGRRERIREALRERLPPRPVPRR